MTYAPTPLDYFGESYIPTYDAFTYHQWDASKTRGCVCDPGFADVDCSKRICNYGTDIMDHRLNLNVGQKYQTQKIQIVAESSSSDADFVGKTFSITFKSKLNETFTTIPIHIQTSDFAMFITDVQSALENLPNDVIDAVQVHGVTSGNEIYLNVTFTGETVEGPQNLLSLNTNLCGDGCTPKLTGLEMHPIVQNMSVSEIELADFNSYECGRRGKCDYTSGLCECFEGYTGLACNVVTALV